MNTLDKTCLNMVAVCFVAMGSIAGLVGLDPSPRGGVVNLYHARPVVDVAAMNACGDDWVCVLAIDAHTKEVLGTKMVRKRHRGRANGGKAYSANERRSMDKLFAEVE